jgi:hypothetical protein
VANRLDEIVELHNNGKQFKSMWDSKEVKINKGDSIQVVRGLAQHFLEQSDELEIREIEKEEPEKRDPVNPLTDNNRGSAFEGLE